jgi:photosystem II stability/assembly factor-like uncharacterized protein
MDDRRNEVDSWLHERIEPLPPPPGTFELIKRRARRRKLRQAAMSAGTLAAVVAAIIVIPRVTTVLSITHNNGSAAANGSAASPGPSPFHSTMGSGRPEAPNSGGPAPGSASARPPVPADFAATSVTFIGARTGWVIGQAGAPGQTCATSYCTSVARTDDGGKTWYGVPAPVTGPPDGASGVSQVRFLDASDGWAFGPGLYATHDGGQHWSEVPTGGYRVTDLETVGDRAFAVFASCTGSGPGFAAQCTSFSLYSAVAGSNDWAPVPGPVSGLSAGGAAGSASVVLTGGRGYVLGPSGTLYAGPVDGSAWQQVGSGPAGGSSCATGPAQADGQPTGALLAAATSSDLVLACPISQASGGGAHVLVSHDGGATWQQSGTAPGGSAVTSVAAQPGGEIALATTTGVDVSHDGGATWQLPIQSGAGNGPSGGFSYVGMTSQEQGVAVPASPSNHVIWFTYDGGLTWDGSAIKG